MRAAVEARHNTAQLLLHIGNLLGMSFGTDIACVRLQDLSPEYAGALLGLSNTAGALPGILGVTSVGFLLDVTQSWGSSLFYPTAACQLIGLVVYTAFASSQRQDWASHGDAKS